MIALCRAHADQADNGAFTDDQLRELKATGKARAQEVRGRFNWMRQDLLAVVGGNFYYEQPIILEIGNTKCIWFDRDDDGYLLLNFKMPARAGRPGAEIEENFWIVSPAVDEVVCPPSGRLVEVSYRNGEKFRAEFFSIASPDELRRRYPDAGTLSWTAGIEFPVTVVELWETAPEADIEFGPAFSRLPGNKTFIWGFYRGNQGAVFHISANEAQMTSMFPEEGKAYTQTDVHLLDLLDKHEQMPRLERFTFTQCVVYGPMVLYPFGAPNIFRDCTFQNSRDQMLYEFPANSSRVGAVPLIGCSFVDCDLRNIGFLGTAEQLRAFAASTASSSTPST
jgi:hypothetical protein